MRLWLQKPAISISYNLRFFLHKNHINLPPFAPELDFYLAQVHLTSLPCPPCLFLVGTDQSARGLRSNFFREPPSDWPRLSLQDVTTFCVARENCQEADDRVESSQHCLPLETVKRGTGVFFNWENLRNQWRI